MNTIQARRTQTFSAAKGKRITVFTLIFPACASQFLLSAEQSLQPS